MNRKLVKPVLFVIFSLSLTAIITGCKESQSTLEQTGNETHASETNIKQ